jgi:hypothetical protein
VTVIVLPSVFDLLLLKQTVLGKDVNICFSAAGYHVRGPGQKSGNVPGAAHTRGHVQVSTQVVHSIKDDVVKKAEAQRWHSSPHFRHAIRVTGASKKTNITYQSQLWSQRFPRSECG